MVIPTPRQIVDNLYWILTSNTSLPDLYIKKCGGFRNEKEIEDLLRSKDYHLIDGGQLIFVEKDPQSEKNKIFYYTVSTDDFNLYDGLYSQLSRMNEIKKLFFIKVHNDAWSTSTIPIKNELGEIADKEILKPKMTVHQFLETQWIDSSFEEMTTEMSVKRGKVCATKKSDVLNYMEDWNEKELIKIYCNRYVLDVVLNLYKKNMMDFDAMIFHNGSYVAIESKEKDPIGKWKKSTSDNDVSETEVTDTSKWAFGWDTRRYAWYYYLKCKTDLDTWYLIREVDHQKSRNFVKWKKLDIEGFSQSAVWHYERQTGRGSTIEASYDSFEDFEEN